MALRSGIQYASITVKQCPMHDEACAKRVIEQIAARYPVAYGKCDCDAGKRLCERVLSKPHQELTSADLELEHTAVCDSRRAIPFNAAALVEEKCGRFVRGQHAGKLRGWAHIEVVTEGGWKKYGPGERNGRVVRPGQVLGIKIVAFGGKTYLEV